MKTGVSIVVSCYNSEKLIRPTLEHLAKSDIPAGFPVELLLIDNASTDNTFQLSKTFWKELGEPFPARFINEQNQGLTYVRERGFTESQYEFIVFVDHDNWLDRNYIKHVFEIFTNNPDIGAAGGKNIAVFEIEKPEWFDRFQHWYAVGELPNINGVTTNTELFGAGMAIRKPAYKALRANGFKSFLTGRDRKSFDSGEDYELCKAIKIAGWKIIYSPELQLKHFMLKERLNWTYFLNLNKGESQSLIYLLAYDYWIEKDNKRSGFHTALKYSWSALLFKTVSKLILLKTKIIFIPDLKKEGSPAIIAFDREKILFENLIKNRSKFLKLKKSIGRAKWRKLKY
jgi:glycosyltransferase involved in cell wall biosynthesis